MEKPKKERGDGIFGWPISGFTILCLLVGIVASNILEAFDIIRPGPEGETNHTPTIFALLFGVTVEILYERWKRRKDRRDHKRGNTEEPV